MERTLRDSSDNNILFAKILDDKKQENSNDAKELRIKNINRHLKSVENFRPLGLISLFDFLEIHSVITSNFTTEKECQELEWMEMILRMIDQKTEEPQKCFPVLTRLVMITAQHPDMHKIVQGKYVSKIIEAIVGSPISIFSLQCLMTCLKEYSGTCGIYKNKIYDYCIATVGSSDLILNRFSAKCLHLLQQTRGGNVGGVAHKKNWAEYHEKLLNTLEELLLNLLQTGETVNTGKSERLKLPEELEVKTNAPHMYSQQSRFLRFQSICIFFNSSLVLPFPASKSILLDRIIAFLDKYIMANQNQIDKKDGDRLLPFVLHTEIQKCLLTMLHSTIKAAGRNMLIYSKDVSDMLWRSLKSTNVSFDEFKIKDISSVRSLVYDVIVEFMKVSPNNHYIIKNTENFIKEAFLDITPIETEILLTLPSNGTNKKKKKRNLEVKRAFGGKTSDNCIKWHQELCIKSLTFINNLLITSNSSIKPVLLKIMADKILIITYKFLSNDMTPQELYHSSECRLKILEVVYNILINPAIRSATPSSFILELLRKFNENDKSEKLRNKASEMIRTVEAVLHNRKDPIHFPPDLKDFRDSWLFNEKTVKAFAEPTNENRSIPVIEKKSDEKVIQIELDEEVEQAEIDVENYPENEESEKDEIESVASPKRRLSIEENEEVPLKVAKIDNHLDEKVPEGMEDEILDSYMADFCNE